MLRLESYLAPVLSGFLNKYIKNLKADALQLSLWGGEATFQQLELRLDNIENEFDLPLELNSGLVRELKIRIPWTRLGSEPVNITIDGLELHCRMRKPQSPSNYTQSANHKEHYNNDADRRTSTGSSAFAERAPDDADTSDYASTDRGRHANSAQDPGYLTTLLRKAKINARVTVKNINVQYYISSEVVLNIYIAELDVCPTDAAWKPTYLSLPSAADEFALRRQINIKQLTVHTCDRRHVKTECGAPTNAVDGSPPTDVNSVLVKTCSFTCRSETVYSDFIVRAIKSVRFHSYFDAVHLVVVSDHLPHLVRLYEYVVAYLSGYVPSAREIRRQAHKLPLNVAASSINAASTAATEDSGWTGWAKSWMGYSSNVPGEADGTARPAYNDAGVQEVIDFLDDDDGDDVTATVDEVEYALFCRQGSLTFATLQPSDAVDTAEQTPTTTPDDIPTVHTDAHRQRTADRTILPFLKLEGRGISTRIRKTTANQCLNITGNIMQATGYNVNFYGYSFPEPIFRMCNNVPDNKTATLSLSLRSLTKDSLFDLDRLPQTEYAELVKTAVEHVNLYSEQVLLSRNCALLWDFVKFKTHDDDSESDSSFLVLPDEQRTRRQNVILRIFTAPMQLLIDDCFAQRLNLIHAYIYDHYPYKRALITPDEELLFETLPLHLAEEELAHILKHNNSDAVVEVPSKTFSLVVPGVEAIVVGLHGMARNQAKTTADMPAAWFPFLCDDVALQQQQGAAAIVLRSPRFEYTLHAPLDHEQIYETFITLLSSAAGSSNRCEAIKHLLFQTQTIRMFSWNAFATIFTASNCLATAVTTADGDNIWHALQTAYACLATTAPAKLLTIQPGEFEYRFTCAPFARAFPLHDVAARYTQVRVGNIDFVGSGADLLLAWNCLCVTFWPDMYVDEPNITENVRHSVVAEYYAVNNISEKSGGGGAVHRMSLRMPSLSISFSAYKSGNFRQHHQFRLEEVCLLPNGTSKPFCLLKPLSSAGESLSYFTQDIVLDVDEQLRTLAGGRASAEVRKLREKYGIKHSVLHLADSLQINLAAEHVAALLNFVVLSRVTDIYGAVVGEDDDSVAAENEVFQNKMTRNFAFSHPAIRFRYAANEAEQTERKMLEVAVSAARLSSSSYSGAAAYYVMQYEKCNFACFVSIGKALELSTSPVITLVDGNITVERHYGCRSARSAAEIEKWIVIGRADSIPISLTPTSLNALLSLAKHAARNADTFRQALISTTPPVSPSFDNAMANESSENDVDSSSWRPQVISHDDLRALPWKYVFHSPVSTADLPPLPKRGEIVFNEGGIDNQTKNAIKSVTWHYAESRSITTLRALPVPLCCDAVSATDVENASLTNNSSVAFSNMPFRILCVLSYYDELSAMFKNFKTFCLSETQEFLLDDSELLLPNSSNKTNRSSSRKRSSGAKFRHSSGHNAATNNIECMPVAETWRIEIQPALQDAQQQQDFAAFSVAALGGCLVVDSCINYSAAPRIQIKLSCQRTELVLSYCAAEVMPTRSMPSDDGNLYVKPAELNVPIEMLRIGVDDTELVARLYKAAGESLAPTTENAKHTRITPPLLITLDVSAWLQATATELASLTRLPLLDPICVHVGGTLVRPSSRLNHADAPGIHEDVPGAENVHKFAGFSYAKLNVSLSAGASGATCATLHINPSIMHSLLRGVGVWKRSLVAAEDSSAVDDLTFHQQPNAAAAILGAHMMLCNNISSVMQNSLVKQSSGEHLAPAIYYQQRISSLNDAGQRLNSKQIMPIYVRTLPTQGGFDEAAKRWRFHLRMCVEQTRIDSTAVDQLPVRVTLDLPTLSSSLVHHDKTRGKNGRQWSKSLTFATKTTTQQDYRVALHCMQLNNVQNLYMLTGTVLIFNDTHIPMTVLCSTTNETDVFCTLNVGAFAYESCTAPAEMQELTVQFSTLLQEGKLNEAVCYASDSSKIPAKYNNTERRLHYISKLVCLSARATTKNVHNPDLFAMLNLIVKPDGIVVMHLTPPMFVKPNSAITWPVYLQPLDVTANSITSEQNSDRYALIDCTSADVDENDSNIAIYNLDLEQCSKLSVKLNSLYARPTTCVDIGRITANDERQIKYEILKDCPLTLIRQHLNETPSERQTRIGSRALLLQPRQPSQFPVVHRATQPSSASPVIMQPPPPPPPPDVVPISMHTAHNSTQDLPSDRSTVCGDVTARVTMHSVLPGCKVLELVPHGLIVLNEMCASFEISLLNSSSSRNSSVLPLIIRGESTSFMPVPAAVFSTDDNVGGGGGSTAANPLDCPVRLRVLKHANDKNRSENGEIIFRIYASKQTKKLQNNKSNDAMPRNLDDAVDCTEYGALPRGGVLRATLASTSNCSQLGFVRFLLIYLYTDPNGLHVLHLRNAYPIDIPKSIHAVVVPLYKLFAWPVGDASAMPSMDDIMNHIPARESLGEISVPKEAWPVLLPSSTANPVTDNLWRRTRYVPAVLPVSVPSVGGKVSYCPSILDTSTYKRLEPHRAVVAENDEDAENQQLLQSYSHVLISRNAQSSASQIVGVMPSTTEDTCSDDALYYASRIQLTVKRRGQANSIEISDANSFLLPSKTRKTSSNNIDSGNGSLVFVIENSCQHEIAVGESLVRRAAVLNEKSQTMEDELFYRMPPVVPAGDRLYYTPPSHALNGNNMQLDDASAVTSNVTLRFGRLVAVRDPKRPTCIWSDDEIVLGPTMFKKLEATPMQCFVSVSGLCSLKLTCVRAGRSDAGGDDMYRIRIDPAGKVDFNTWRRIASSTAIIPVTKQPEFADNSPSSNFQREKRTEPQQFVATIKLQSVCVCIEDTLLAPNALVELVRLTLDRFQAQIYAVANLSAVELALTLHSAQLDNQLALLPPSLQQELLGFTNGYFDFPVVLIKGDTYETTTNVGGGKNAALQLRDENRREKNSQPILNLVLNIAWRQQQQLHTGSVLNIVDLRKLFVSTSSCSVFLEDRFVYTLLQLSDHFIVPDLIALFVAAAAANLPTPSAATDALVEPIKTKRSSTVIAIDKLFVSPLFINLSLHASLSGLFIAVNSSPLFFEELELGGGTKCTPQELVATLFMHYASITLLKAGMVLGSADLLGNPVNLLRSFGRGIHDAFLLPCLQHGNNKARSGEVIQRSRSFSGAEGRLSFAEALTQGARSLFSNISMGSLTSLTRWFESLSRNLDNLVYDPDYMRRRMELTAAGAPIAGQLTDTSAMYDSASSRPQSGNRNSNSIDAAGNVALMTTPPSVVAPMLVGLQHGLAGFGFSLLGALAGVVDQPMRAASQVYKKDKTSTMLSPKRQVLTPGAENVFIIDADTYDDDSENDDGENSNKSGSVLRALLTGLGRGLLGMLTKPLAGATSLVAQTGAGLLQGMSVARPPMPRFHNHVVPMSEFLTSSPPQIPASVTLFDSNGNYERPVAAVYVTSSNAMSDNTDSTSDRILMLTRSSIVEVTTEGVVIRVVSVANVAACNVRADSSANGLSSASSTASSSANDGTALMEVAETVYAAAPALHATVSVSLHLYTIQQAHVSDAQLFCAAVRLLQILALV